MSLSRVLLYNGSSAQAHYTRMNWTCSFNIYSLAGWRKWNLRCDSLFSRSLIVFLLFENVFTYATLNSFCSSLVCFALSFISNAITKWWKVIYNLQFCVYFIFRFYNLIFCDFFSSSSCCLTVCVSVCCVFFCVSHELFFSHFFSLNMCVCVYVCLYFCSIIVKKYTN